MSSKYEKSYLHEEEGTYHRREIEPIAPRDEKNYTTHHETSYQVVKPNSHKTASSSIKPLVGSRNADTSDDENNFEEWTTSKRKINHKTRQVETRVSRQLLVEDGKVIADSGPQVTTRIKEDNKIEECEKEKTPKNKSKFDAISCAPEGESSGRVLGEKKEIQRVSREIREENMQYHDERFKELTGHDVHKKAIKAPHELITINDDKSHHASSAPRGKMVHYSNKGKKYQDTDEILEVAKLAIDGSITKEVKRTRHHEECSEDELPDEKGEAEALRDEPIVTRSSRRHVDYVNDFDDTATPSCSSDDEVEGDPQAIRRHKAQGKQHSSSRPSRHHQHGSGRAGRTNEEAFPRYEIDPLLNSLRDEDFRPTISADNRQHSGRYKEVPLVRREKHQESSDEYETRHNHHSPSPVHRRTQGAPVEIPEEYRVNRQRFAGAGSKQRERSFSPPVAATNRSAHRTNVKHHHIRDQDASVQAHLTDEEVERRSMRSQGSGSVNSHEKQTRHLQRQSTANSSRNYYYGKPKHQRQRAPSISSSSSSLSSIGDNLKDRQRKKGIKSRDSGFRSPHSNRQRPETPNSGSQQQIYSVSSKAKKQQQQQQRPISPTGSVGQRSVKTTTTTLSAGLQDRPRSRQSATKSPSGAEKTTTITATTNKRSSGQLASKSAKVTKQQTDEECCSFDTISLASLGTNATTIRVPYKGDVMESEPVRYNYGEKATTTTTNRRRDRDLEQSPSRHFNYRTIIANVQPVPIVPKQQIIDAYNVRVIEHKSPFLDQIQPIKSMSDLSSSIARLEQLSSDLSSLSTTAKPRPVPTTTTTVTTKPETNTNNTNHQGEVDNNNEANFNLSQFMKQKPSPFQVFNYNTEDNQVDEGDNVSLVSTCSLKSSRTYHICTQDSTLKSEHKLNLNSNDDLNDPSDFPVESAEFQEKADENSNFDETSDEKKPKAWVFDLRDNSATTIVAPIRIKEPEAPKIDAKTEELAKSRGGRSYYLELIDKEPKKKVNENLYTRWSSQNALNSSRKVSSSDSSTATTTTTKNPSREEVNSRISRQSMTSKPNSNCNKEQQQLQKQQQARSSSVTPNNRVGKLDSGSKEATGKLPDRSRRQLPFSGPPLQLGNRSKSVSCLASSTRPSKYSIYGGFKKPDSDKKPVPRLSYSRAIGPKSQRQIDNQPKTPSRYLKMK